MGIKEEIQGAAKAAREASYKMAASSTEEKNNALQFIKEGLEKNIKELLEANAADIKNAEKSGLSKAMIDRLTLNEKRIRSMADSLKDIAALPDPVGEITAEWERPNRMKIKKMRVPLGVIGIIFESRPNVCVEAASLALKSGNAVILRGGSDAITTNVLLGDIISDGIKKAGLSGEAAAVIRTTDREAVAELLRLRQYIDVIIPRGGKGLVDFVAENSLIPVIYHDAGICHTYVDLSLIHISEPTRPY